MSSASNEKIEKACEAAFEKFKKINKPEFADTQSKLEYVIGSYRYDGNPVGLYEVGEKALDTLKAYKAEKPKQVSKKLIDDLEKALKEA